MSDVNIFSPLLAQVMPVDGDIPPRRFVIRIRHQRNSAQIHRSSFR